MTSRNLRYRHSGGWPHLETDEAMPFHSNDLNPLVSLRGDIAMSPNYDDQIDDFRQFLMEVK